jgi:hypothetical protein
MSVRPSFGHDLPALRRDRKSVGTGVAVIATGVVAGFVGGVQGWILGAVFVLLGGVLSPLYLYAVGHAGLILLFPMSSSVVELVLIEVAFAGVLVAPLIAADWTVGEVLNSLLWPGLGLVGVVVTGWQAGSSLGAGLLLFLVVMTFLYGVHRYERVMISPDDDDGGDG